MLASDSPRIHKFAEKTGKFDRIVWLENSKSLFSVYDDVKKFISIINVYLKNISSNNKLFYDETLFHWLHHVEGGNTTQKIQDALLLIDSYIDIIKTNDISKISEMIESKYIFEDSVLNETASHLKINLEFLNDFNFLKKIFRVKLIVKSLLKNAYYSLKFLTKISGYYSGKYLFCFNKSINKNRGNEMIFQLVGASEKHIENIIPVMKELEKLGYSPVILCLNSGKKIKYLNKTLKLNAEELESYIPVKSIIESLFYSIKILFKLNALKKEFYNVKTLEFKGVFLNDILFDSILFFLFDELPKRHRLNEAIKRFLKNRNPAAVKLWGGGNLIEGDLLYKNIIQLLPRKPVFINWFWLTAGAAYSETAGRIDLYLAAGKIQKRHLMNFGIPQEKIKLTGMIRYSDLNSKKTERFNANQIRDFLKSSIDFDLYILYDLANSVRGIQPVSEQIRILSYLLEFAEKQNKSALIIKPHPNCDTGEFVELFEKYNFPNIFVMNKNTSALDCLAAADIFVTKTSTMGLEAMRFGIPMINIILDAESKWELYGSGAVYIYNLEDYGAMMKKLLADKSFRKFWIAENSENQKKFLKEYFEDLDKSPAETGAAVIDEFVKKISDEI